MKLRKKSTPLALVTMSACVAALVLIVPSWRRAVVRMFRTEAAWAGHPTSYWREEICRLSRPPAEDNLFGNIAVRLSWQEDRNQSFFRHRYPPLTHPGPPPSEPYPPEPDKLAVVLELIDDDDAKIRAYAARFLDEFGDWPEAIAAALRLLDDDNADVRLHAVGALAEIGPRAQAAVPRLRRLMTQTQETYHIAAARALWHIERDQDSTVPVLAAALRSSDSLHRQRALDALTEMGSAAAAAFPELCAVSIDDDRTARMYALRVLGTFGKRSVPALVAGLNDEDAVVRGWACEGLDKVGPDAIDAVPSLQRILQYDSAQHVRESAAKALRSIDPIAFPPLLPKP